MDELKTTTDLVRYVLLMYPNTRDSDNYLYYRVLKIIGDRKGIDIDSMSVTTFFMNLRQYGFPTFETVCRIRRKLQEKYPEFVGSDSINAYRDSNERRFRKYAREGV